MKNDKKGIAGLDIVKLVVISLLSIAIIFIASLFVMNTLNTTTNAADLKNGGSVYNETLTAVPTTGSALTASTKTNCVVTISAIRNATGGEVLSAGNYTTSGCYVYATATSEYIGENWNVSYSYKYNLPYTANIINNISSGSATFFSYVPTFFVLLAVVVLILIIAIVIIAVSRFRQEENL